MVYNMRLVTYTYFVDGACTITGILSNYATILSQQ
jgi:hypothetical protein